MLVDGVPLGNWIRLVICESSARPDRDRDTQRRASNQTTPPARPVRARPWEADGYTDRTTGTDTVRYASVARLRPGVVHHRRRSRRPAGRHSAHRVRQAGRHQTAGRPGPHAARPGADPDLTLDGPPRAVLGLLTGLIDFEGAGQLGLSVSGRRDLLARLRPVATD